jgi:Na+-translocating ferredoxin:NAD+ oxidoreductase RnfD subunit
VKPLVPVTRWLRTPKAQMLIIQLVLIGIAWSQAGGATLWPKLAAAVVPAVAIDGIWMTVQFRRFRWPESALLTGLFVFMILSSDESWLVFAWTAACAILAKRLLRTDREHVFNPAALALVWAPIAFGSGESWWGALGDMPMVWVVVLLAAGAFLTDRLNKFPSVLMFLTLYYCLFTAVSLVNPGAVAEMFRAPFVQAALFMAFFMVTDPPTSPNRYGDQAWYGAVVAVVACVAQLLGAGQTYLLLGLLAANAVLAAVRYARRHANPQTVGATA